MLNKIHTRTKNILFPNSKQDWHYLLQLLLLVVIISSPVFEIFLPFRQAIFGIVAIAFILYGILLINKPRPAIIVSGIFAVLIVLLNFSVIDYDFYSLATREAFIKAEMIIFVIFLIFLGAQLLNDTLNEQVSMRLIYISMQNYLIIGLIFSYLFRLLHLFDPLAFNFAQGHDFNYSYLSFIVLSSVGLGDLLPLSNAAKAMMIVEATTGQFYLTFFVAIIIGKFLSESKKGS